jgi:hypothetical protein
MYEIIKLVGNSYNCIQSITVSILLLLLLFENSIPKVSMKENLDVIVLIHKTNLFV